MSFTRLLALSFLGASALVACGSSGATGGPGTSSGSTGSGASSPAGSGSGGGGAPSSSATGAGALGGSGPGNDGGIVIDIDSGLDDGSTACTHLNIGIFGNPGANASANFQQWLTAAGTSVQRVQTTPTDPLTAATLQPFDVVILDWLTRDYTTAEASTFATWIAAGGGIVSMTGYDNNTTDDWHANSLLAPLQVAYSGPLLSGPVTSFATHPITAGLTSVTFEGGYAISDLGGTASTRTPIAFLPGGSGTVTAGFAIQMSAGRAFVWGDEWIEFDSEWTTQPQIKQLWVQVFGWISPVNKCALMPPT
jgi:hypothetical protein